MDSRKKLLLIVAASGTVAVLSAAALILQSTEVIDLTRYFPIMEPGQQTPAATTATATDTPTSVGTSPAGTDKPTNGETPTPDSSGKGGDRGTSTDGDLGGKGSTPDTDTPTEQPVTEYGSIGTQVGTRNESRTDNPGFISSTVMKLTEQATAWAQPGRQPRIGDRIGITLPVSPEGKRFVIEVVYISERADGSGMTLHGKLEELGSTVLMMTVGNTLNLAITDYASNRIYYVSHIAGTDEYTVEEWDLSKQPKTTEFLHPNP